MPEPLKSPSGSCDPGETNWIDIDPTNTVQHKWEVATVERWIKDDLDRFMADLPSIVGDVIASHPK